MQVLLYDGESGELLKTLSRFKDVALCGAFRNDGKLVVAGGADGLVQIFNPNARTIMRTFRGHKGNVRVTKFRSDNLQVVSGGDDKTLRVWDMPSDKQISLLSGHTDYIRSAMESPTDPNLWITGSYDHSIRYWDLRSNVCVLTITTILLWRMCSPCLEVVLLCLQVRPLFGCSEAVSCCCPA